ncbi:MAG: gamma-glutamyltransferase family protein [Leptospirales bacterium]|nr:gamma-glutamyltransferase family protein [Leptospirales bacterium]
MNELQQAALWIALAAGSVAGCRPADPVVLDGHSYSAAELVQPPEHRNWQEYSARGRQWAVATDSPDATGAALQVYKAGGNAIDAAVAASFVLAVVRPQSTGLGGGGFLIYHDARRRQSFAYDFRERAPSSARADMYRDAEGRVDARASLFGPRAIATPGFVPGLLEIHRRHGRLPLSAILAPALRLASNGFVIYPDLASSISDALPDMDEEMRQTFAAPGARDNGQLLRQPMLARTLQTIIESGDREFRSGTVARAMVRSSEGQLSLADLKNYQVRRMPPLQMQIGNQRLETMPPPSSGVFLLLMVAGFQQAGGQAICGSDSLHCVHLKTELLRRAFADRARYGGEGSAISPGALLSPARITRVVAGINMQKATSSRQILDAENQSAESTQTTHVSLMDQSGDGVSVTHSINYRFGSRRMAPGTGIVMNDTMDDFAVAPGQANVYGLVGDAANAIAPGRTPLSSMSPLLAYQGGQLQLALGAPGGSRILSTIFESYLHAVAGDPAYVAVARGRIHHQWQPDTLFYEAQSAASRELPALQAMGHKLSPTQIPAKAFLTLRRGAYFEAASDPRGDGLAGAH